MQGTLSAFDEDAGLGTITAWRDKIAGQPWSEAFVYFKHEDEAKGPHFAGGLARIL